MNDLLNEVVSPEDLQKFENIYHQQLYKNDVTPKAQFEYAWCLVRSKYPVDIKKGLVLLQELFTTHEEGKRDYLFYLALGNARLKQYRQALNFLNAFLNIEPNNSQVIGLKNVIEKKMTQEGLKGIAITGGAIVALGAVVSLGISLLGAAKK
ncbi:mitochondrial fission 1 protein [Agrilus planipennis]|uniref:Mitochondrial fission 1 protein n=1 Tax=Agrilus planipennis TaxID=224129 RepID=A0A1W4XS76_AGRPL|nr:mitochondrial fission 1 protein [Agrilus planipennis]